MQKEISMEVFKDLIITLHIETNKRRFKKNFKNLFDIQIFMNGFFTKFADSRSSKFLLRDDTLKQVENLK